MGELGCHAGGAGADYARGASVATSACGWGVRSRLWRVGVLSACVRLSFSVQACVQQQLVSGLLCLDSFAWTPVLGLLCARARVCSDSRVVGLLVLCQCMSRSLCLSLCCLC